MGFEKEHYENSAFWDKEIFWGNEQEKERLETCKNIIPKDVKSLCDIGAGNGAFICWLEQTELTLEMSGIERSNAARKNKCCKSELIDGDIQELPLQDEAVDIITCMEVIEHLPVDIYEKGLKELERAAKKYILISVPYNETRGFVECTYCGAQFQECYHVRSFHEDQMSNLFSDSFNIEKITFIARNFVLKPIGHRVLRFANYVLKRKNEMPAGRICPQCGYKSVKSMEKSSGVKKKTFFKKIKSTTAKLLSTASYRWMAVLYKRK